jgi:phosphoribosylcarboxyaminoimidazole (NCAIR) mutase
MPTKTLDQLKIPYEAKIISAHRTPGSSYFNLPNLHLSVALRSSSQARAARPICQA